MSCDIVPVQHIQALVHTALNGVLEAPADLYPPLSWLSLPAAQLAGMSDAEIEDFERLCVLPTADLVGQMLMDENVVSYGHAYPNKRWDDYPLWSRLPYAHQPLEFRLTAVECLKAIEGFEYQSCEHAGWCESEAFSFCRSLQAYALPFLPGWERAPFLWDGILTSYRSRRRGSLV